MDSAIHSNVEFSELNMDEGSESDDFSMGNRGNTHLSIDLEDADKGSESESEIGS